MRLLTCHGAGLNNDFMSKNTEKQLLVRALQGVHTMYVPMSVADAYSYCARQDRNIHISVTLAANATSNFDRLKWWRKSHPTGLDCVFVKKGDFGQVSSVYGQSEPDRNPDTYKMDRRKGRKRKHPLFRACHMDRRQNTSCGIHIDLEYKFVGAHDG